MESLGMSAWGKIADPRNSYVDPVLVGTSSGAFVAGAGPSATPGFDVIAHDATNVPIPGRVGRWMTERFNDWPEGSRDDDQAASEAAGLPYSKGVDPAG